MHMVVAVAIVLPLILLDLSLTLMARKMQYLCYQWMQFGLREASVGVTSWPARHVNIIGFAHE